MIDGNGYDMFYIYLYIVVFWESESLYCGGDRWGYLWIGSMSGFFLLDGWEGNYCFVVKYRRVE